MVCLLNTQIPNNKQFNLTAFIKSLRTSTNSQWIAVFDRFETSKKILKLDVLTSLVDFCGIVIKKLPRAINNSK